MAFAIFFTDDLLRECAFSSRTSAFDQARRLVRLARLLAIGPRAYPEPTWDENTVTNSNELVADLITVWTSNLAVCNDELGFLLGADIVAPPPHGNPHWMLVDPLRDVGLRIHDALIERHVSRERKMLIFALTRQRQCADGYDQFDQAHPNSLLVTQYKYVVSLPGVSSFRAQSFQPFQATARSPAVMGMLQS